MGSSSSRDVSVEAQGLVIQETSIGNGVALSFDGGGFASCCVMTALMTSLLSTSSKKSGLPTFEGSGILDRFGTLSSVSGGTWFISELIYSSSFRALVEEMAASPKEAANNYNKKWIDPWIGALKVTDGDAINDLSDVVASLPYLGQAYAESILMVDYVYKKGWAWTDFVDGILKNTAGIGDDVRFDSDVQAWAKDKVWLVCHSMITPTAGKEATLASSFSFPEGLEAYRFSLADAGKTEFYTPARFSWQLGKQAGTAPASYVANSALDSSAKMSWSGVAECCHLGSSNGLDKKSAALPPFPEFTQYAGALPVNKLVSCSSACIGGFAAGMLLPAVDAVVRVDLPIWATSASDGAAFKQGAELVNPIFKQMEGVTQPEVDAFANASLRGLVDGVYTDNTAIGHCIATGATEITSIIQGGEGFIGLFQGPYKITSALGDNVPLMKFQNPQIFKETQDWASEQLSGTGFKPFKLMKWHKILQDIRVGTVVVTTVENKRFGITADRVVTINVIQIKTELTTGFFENFKEYASICGEIVDDLINVMLCPENSDAHDVLCSFFNKGA